MQLSLQQAIQMALERNLDIQLEEVDQSVADFSLTRTQGGATPRAINFNIAETPIGEVIAFAPLLATTSPTLSPYGIEPSTITIPSSYDAAHVLQPYRSLSIATAPFSAGAPVPALDLSLQGQYGWIRRDPSNSLVTSSSATAADTTVTNNTLGSTALLKGFSSGTSIQLGINNAVWSLYSGRSSAVPFTHPNAYALIAQPLLRGAGRENNTRYIAIAKTNKNIAAAILEQQIIAIVAGVEGLYYDLVSLQNSVRVQQKALDAADTLLSNDRQQSAVGRLPPIGGDACGGLGGRHTNGAYAGKFSPRAAGNCAPNGYRPAVTHQSNAESFGGDGRTFATIGAATSLNPGPHSTCLGAAA
jgi:hypothetical protein